MDYDFSNLTRAQVEALLECFDFLNNGYEERSSFEVEDLWVIQVRHKRTYRVIRVFIKPDRYRIAVEGKTKKKVYYPLGSDRFRLVVNSPRDIGVIRLNPGGDQKLVSN